jgi:hypothetical protein
MIDKTPAFRRFRGVVLHQNDVAPRTASLAVIVAICAPELLTCLWYVLYSQAKLWLLSPVLSLSTYLGIVSNALPLIVATRGSILARRITSSGALGVVLLFLDLLTPPWLNLWMVGLRLLNAVVFASALLNALWRMPHEFQTCERDQSDVPHRR